MSGNEKDKCVSGGASGADSLFAKLANEKGHSLRIYSFDLHVPDLDPSIDRGTAVKVMTQLELDSFNKRLQEVSNVIAKYYPSRRFVRNLLLRDMAQAKYADTVYAVGWKDLDAMSTNPAYLGIDGGTAYACQAFVRKAMNARETEDDVLKSIPLYFYDQAAQSWYQVSITRTEAHLLPMETPPPSPCGFYAGIGSRKLNASGELAISALFS